MCDFDENNDLVSNFFFPNWFIFVEIKKKFLGRPKNITSVRKSQTKLFFLWPYLFTIFLAMLPQAKKNIFNRISNVFSLGVKINRKDSAILGWNSSFKANTRTLGCFKWVFFAARPLNCLKLKWSMILAVSLLISRGCQSEPEVGRHGDYAQHLS